MENDVSPRFAKSGDFEFVYSGRKEIAELEAFAIPNVEDDKKRLLEAIDAERVLLAVRGNSAVGFIWFVVSDTTPFGVDYGAFGSKYAWVDYVFVAKAEREKGVGAFLYEELAKWCADNGIAEILCDVYESNPQSMAFHEKLGFRPFLRIYSRKTA